MIQNQLPKGVYLAIRPAEKMGGLIDHYGVVEIGNVLGLVEYDVRYPIVYEKNAGEGLVVNYTDSRWKIVSKVDDQFLDKVKLRLNSAFQNPGYDLFGNNCEHFARYIVEGKSYSGQLQTAGVIAGLVGIIWLANRDSR
ncbi:hypothetical protein EHQ23_05235 [Leptospira bourretii]|uniref:LRAT domain-containing protein n=1 Tax=Leptospira bourretii TaxID=2484962 RepID=A0A4V6QLJ6_9LEPT|nr:hypothetical protein [Leptospira bourretii]TGK88243.1 hypothetical protein EHQ23_05235 [Leptospira bourretii]TGK88893.1 hypothetical protein EHQ26_17760 [Leptospira bourretii]TGL37943.1 hypothetical protein EHQ45_06340 [Leptospira bourretii]